MTKKQANQKFIDWINAHPSDDWCIIGGNEPEQSAYVAVAFERRDGDVVHFRCEYGENND